MTRVKGCFVWILRLTGLFILLIIIGLAIGYFLETQAEIADAERFPARGEVLTVADRTMHLYCTGVGESTVILDAGLGGWSIDFVAMQAAIAEETRVCSYDRAGYGWSSAAQGARDAQSIASDLRVLLDASAIQEPIILLGFSYSGLSSRLFALQNPESVAALILLDPAHESDMSLYTGELAQQQEALVGVYGFFGGMARFGIIRFLNPEEMSPYAPFIGQGRSAEYYAAVSAPQWWQTSQQEFMAMIDGSSAEQVRKAGDLADDLPLIVFAAGIQPLGLPENIGTSRRENLAALANQSELGQFIVAEDTDHNAMLNRVDLVLAALSPLLETNSDE